MHAAAGDDEGPFGRRQERRRVAQRVGRRDRPVGGRATVAVVHHGRRVVGLPLGIQDVVRHDERHRAGAAGRRDAEGRPHQLGEGRQTRHVEDGLGDRGEERHLIEAL